MTLVADAIQNFELLAENEAGVTKVSSQPFSLEILVLLSVLLLLLLLLPLLPLLLLPLLLIVEEAYAAFEGLKTEVRNSSIEGASDGQYSMVTAKGRCEPCLHTTQHASAPSS